MRSETSNRATRPTGNYVALLFEYLCATVYFDLSPALCCLGIVIRAWEVRTGPAEDEGARATRRSDYIIILAAGNKGLSGIDAGVAPMNLSRSRY